MRAGVEGVTPDFDKTITEYDLIVNETVSNLNLTLQAENPESKINVYGNNNFKTGLNKVTIEVISQDKSSKKNYTINITKTNQPQKANANLQTLAIENFRLEPVFSPDTTEYTVDVPSNTNNVNIFAVPESLIAKIEVNNKETLDIGNNKISVKVIAENGITTKTYLINVHKRTQIEEEEEIKEQEENQEKLSEILEEQELEKIAANPDEQPQPNKNNWLKWILIIVIPTAIIAGITTYIIRRIKKKM